MKNMFNINRGIEALLNLLLVAEHLWTYRKMISNRNNIICICEMYRK